MYAREKFVNQFREIQPKFSRIYARALHRVDLTLPQYALLNQLALLGSVSMTEISSRLRITKPAVTNLVDRLEEKKFIKRAPHPGDRRVVLLHILTKGKNTVSKIQAYALDLLLGAYDQFDSEEHQVIDRFYATLSRVMDEFLARGQNVK